MSQLILVVEDEQDLATTIQYNLRKEGYHAKVALNGGAAMDALAADPAPDLVLLDLMLPDTSGVEICRKMRSSERLADIPVLMLTAKGEEIDRVVGFEVGADDYVVKPFSVRELLLRVRAILKRSNPAPTQRRQRYGRLCIDEQGHRVWVDDNEVSLTALEFKLLATFVARRGRAQSRDTLLSDVWGVHAEVTTRTVDTHVKRLREKLGEAGKYIETLRGVGYRFEGPAEGAD